MVTAVNMADEGQVITKRKIAVVVRKFISKKTRTTIARTVITKLGSEKMKKMGKKKVVKVVKRKLRGEAIHMLKEVGFKSACQGACGRRMKVVAEKVKAERKKHEKQIVKLTKFKKEVVVK